MKHGDHVAWEWANGLAEGVIKSVHMESTTITSKGKQITRHGSKDDPAIVIERESSNDVLKLAHEIKLAEKGES